MRVFRKERGQALVLTVMLLMGLLGMTAFVVDVGSWFRAQRDAQVVADAAALAGAQALPDSPDEARALAQQYAAKNGIDAPAIGFSSSGGRVDTIHVDVRRDTPGFFAKVFGIDAVNVGAKAAAKAFVPGAVRWVAPITVNYLHPMLNCNPQPCYGPQYPTEIELDHLHKPGSGSAAGSFALISLNDDDLDADTLSLWLLKGYDGFMELSKDRGDDYRAAPSANFNNGQFQSALEQRKGTEMLFPIYKKISGSGSTAEYEIIGFVSFVVVKVIGGGSAQKLQGYFTKVVWEGIEASSGSPASDYGVRSIELIE